MKTSLSIIFSFIVACSGFCADATARVPKSPVKPVETPTYVVKERGPHERVWEWTEYETTPDGAKVPHVHQFVEVATGLHYWRDGKWLESTEEIEISPNGGAAATKGQHQAYFPADIYEGTIELVTPDGVHLQSRPLGLSYFDGSKSVLIAELTNSIGMLLPNSNQVVYAMAFDGVDASLRYTYTKAGFEQDVILNAQPPGPEEFGLNPATTRLQLLTEFFEPPKPAIKTHHVSEQAGVLVADQTLAFGQMQMGRGMAFPLGSPGTGAEVSKQWTVLDGRQFLVEEVVWGALTNGLQQLPQPTAQIRRKAGSRSVAQRLSLPAQRVASNKSGRSIQTAKLSISSGLVLDYATLNTGQTNYTFRGDTTYYLSGDVGLNGTNNTFEGGTVLKYATNVTLTVNTPVTWLGSAYRPVVMVSKNDNSVGDIISGANNDTTNYAAATALYFDATTANTNLVLQNLRVGQARTAVAINGLNGHVLSHVQLVNCGNGLALTNAEVALRNALMTLVWTNFTGSSSTGRVEHLTSDRASQICANIGANLFITNSLFVLVTNASTFTSAYCSSNSAAAGIFTNVGGGNYYLVSGSTNRDAGTTNISASLLRDLKKLTTYPPPFVLANVSFGSSSSSNLVPLVQRDTDLPDLGYHYDPLDYLLSQISFGPPLYLSNGVAIGLFGTVGFVPSSAGFISKGRADAMNRLAWYPAVQEQPIRMSNVSVGSSALFTTSSAAFVITLRFTDMPMQGSSQKFFDNCFIYQMPFVTIENCWLRGVNLTIGAFYIAPPFGGVPAITLQNNLLERGSINLFSGYVLDPGGNPVQNPLYVTLYNNLFWSNSVTLSYRASLDTVHATWTIKDNLYDGAANGFSGDGSYSNYISISNDAFYNTSNPLGGSNHVTLTSFTYASGPLGNYYQFPTNLVDRGSRNATNAGLYHFTTQTNQVKEGSSQVDIGFHYVALDGSGNPVDSNLDGIPDYVQDINGNGQVDGSEVQWLPTPPSITQPPASVSVVEGFNATFNVVASGSAPLSYQWRLNTTPIPGALYSQFVVSGAQTSDAGQYSVVVTNLGGSTTSGNATLVVVPLSWMQQYFGPDYANNPLAALGADADGDGLSNVQEYLGGTDPTDFYNGVLPNLAYSSGNNQSGSLNAFLAQPLIVRVTTGGVTPINNAPVVFSVSSGFNQLSSTSGGAVSQTVTVRSDSNGYATAWLFLPSNASLNNNVTAKIQSGASSTQVVFTETALITDTPVMNPNGGTFKAMQDVVLTSQTSGATIGYTLNGTTPNEASPSVTSGQSTLVQGSATLAARVFKTGSQLPGATATAVFNITGGISAGGNHSLALKYDRSPWAAGLNSDGQLGDNTLNNGNNLAAVLNLTTGVISVSAGGSHSLALLTDGTVRAWGLNASGQLGDNSLTTRKTNVAVLNLTNVRGIAAGGLHSLALLTDGTVRAWGENGNGQIGINSTVDQKTSVAVSGLSSVASIAAGGSHSLAVLSNSTVVAWGDNSNGEIGDNTLTDRKVPTPVSSLTNVIAVAGGGLHSLALMSDSTVRAWGDNANGQLGDNTLTDRKTNVVVLGLTNVVAIAAGDQHSLALLNDGTVQAWGDNSKGQLGDGTITDRKTNVVVIGLSNVVAISAGKLHSLALLSDGTVAIWGYTNYGLNSVAANFTNRAIIKEASVHLIYWAAPSIVTQPQNQTVVAGQTATFTVNAFGTQSLSYQWYSNNTAIAGAASATLTLNNVQTSAAGNYFVTVANNLGSVTSSVASLTVIVPPSIVIQPVTQNAAIGASVTFTVVAAGTSPQYQWYGLNSGKLVSSTSSTLTFANVQAANADNYYVVVSNGGGSVASATAALRLPPVFTSQPVSLIIAKGSTANFNAVVTGAPTLGYQWYSFDTGFLPAQTGTSLSLNNVQSSGTYYLLAMNGFASVASFAAQLTVTDPATDPGGNGLPDSWELTNFGTTGVNPNADPDGDGWSNLQEYQNGTNPNVADQPFKISITEPSGTSPIP